MKFRYHNDYLVLITIVIEGNTKDMMTPIN